MLDHLAEINEAQEKSFGDSEISSRISHYEMAYRLN